MERNLKENQQKEPQNPTGNTNQKTNDFITDKKTIKNSRIKVRTVVLNKT